MTDLVALTAELVDIASVSHHEQELVAHIQSTLADIPGLSIDRVGDNLVARTNLGHPQRILLGGHTDTVPPNGNATSRLEGDTLWGCGTADMKGGLAIMMELARTIPEPAMDITYLFYAREEIAIEHNGLREIVAERPDLLEADFALLGEPTSGLLEAGCQGTMRFRLELAGKRSHTARPWMGRNAIHRLGSVLEHIAGYQHREPVLSGCRYREALQAVFVEGGVAGNVVPDLAVLTVNHRFAPDRSIAEAEEHIRTFLAPVLDDGDTLVVTDAAPAAPPGLDNPLLKSFVDRYNIEVLPKLGWTDAAFFAERGVPAANLGPGDATLAHTAEERVEREVLDRSFAILSDLLRNGLG